MATPAQNSSTPDLQQGTEAPREPVRTHEPFAEPEDPLELPFDQYQRYRLVADVVSRLLPGGRGSILDVGGRTALLRKFLPGSPITLVDYEPSGERGLVLGDGSRLPFRDSSFDAVTACDTLEHVPAERRDAFVRECARVSRGAIVIAGPYRQERVDEAEELLASFVRNKLGFRHRYLEEHRMRGLPELAAVERALVESGAQVTSIGHANLERWLALMCLELYMDEEPQLRRVARRYFRFYNQGLYTADFSGPHYRHAVVGWKGGGELSEQLAGIERGPGSSPAQRPFAELLTELVAFDRERDVYEAERTRLIANNDALERDLEGHRAVIQTQAAEIRAQAAVIEELRADVGALRAHLPTVEAELQDTKRNLAAVQDVLLANADVLRAKTAQIEALEERLRDRRDAFRRAFTLGRLPD